LQRRRPGRWLYVVAGVVFGIGALAAATLFVFLGAGPAQAYPFNAMHIIAPGQAEIALAEPGHYTIGYEYETVLAGRVFNTPPRFPSIDLQLVRAADGSHVPIDLVSGTSTYEDDNIKGEDIAEFSIDRAGKYVLVSQYGAGQEGPQVVLAVGRNADVAIGLEVFGLVGGIAFMLAGAVMAIVVVILRARAQVPTGLGRAQSTLPPSGGNDGFVWQPTGTLEDQRMPSETSQASDQGRAPDSSQAGSSEAGSGGAFDSGWDSSSDSSSSSDSGSSFDSGSSSD